MRPTSLSILLLGLSASPTPAGDFTGFYAGVNAGYAIGLDGGRVASPSLGRDPDALDESLPPSARSAASSVTDRREPARRAGAPRR